MFQSETEMTRVRRLGNVTFAVSSVQRAVDTVHTATAGRRPEVFAFCNMHTFNLARRSAAFADTLSRCTVFNDGVGMDVASRVIHGMSFAANLNGTDLTPAVLTSGKRPLAIYIVGGTPGVAEEAGRRLAGTHKGVTIVGTHHGYFDATANAVVLEQVRSARPDLVLVGMGNPRQEHWALAAAAAVGCPMMCVGAFIDFAAGRFPRAPRWARNLRIEWLHRLALEPRRLASRYLLGGLAFAWAIAVERFSLRTPAPAHSNHEPTSFVSEGF